MKTLKKNDGFKDDGKYAVWGTQGTLVSGRGLELLDLTNNKRQALDFARRVIREGWSHVIVRENKYSGYPTKILLNHGAGNFVTG